MVKYKTLFALEDLIRRSEEETQNFLRSFLCSKNKKLENFLHTKAIDADKRGLNKTYLLLEQTEDDNGKVIKTTLLGYFTLANKIFNFAEDVSRTKRKMFGESKMSTWFSTILIANIAKNEGAVVNGIHPISGNDLMDMAIEKCKPVKKDIGLNIVALEFEDHPKLKSFYEDYGFLIIQDNVHNGYKLACLKI